VQVLHNIGKKKYTCLNILSEDINNPDIKYYGTIKKDSNKLGYKKRFFMNKCFEKQEIDEYKKERLNNA